jgi:AraC-like DNA-binding protein
VAPIDHNTTVYQQTIQIERDMEELSMDETLLAKLHEVVTLNIKNEQFSVEDLASEVAMSRSHLHRKLQRLTNQSCSQFIREIRLAKSMELLQKEVGTVSEISFRVGFSSSSYFIKCFSERFGFSPGELKKQPQESLEKAHDQPEHQHSNTPLEFFHPASEPLIREIFDQLVVFKPSLGKHLMIDEDEGEYVDIRILAYQIIKSYPWPIGVELRRLFSSELRDNGPERFQQLNNTIVKNLKLIAYSLIGELTTLIENNKLKINSKESDRIVTGLENLSHKDIVEIIQTCVAAISDKHEDLVIGEIINQCDSQFFRELTDWLDLSHEDNDCATLEQILIFILKRSAFFAKYKLVNVGQVRVFKSRFENATFEHQFHLLNNTDTNFHIKEETLQKYSDNNAVLLMKSIQDPSHFLNLNPLVIDTQSEEPSKGYKRDVFLFDGVKKDEFLYSGADTGQQVIFEDTAIRKAYSQLIAMIKR